MTVHREIASAGVKVRRLNARDVIHLADTRNVFCDVCPGGAAIAAHLNVTVVGAGPQNARHDRRLGDGYNVTVAGVAVVL